MSLQDGIIYGVRVYGSQWRCSRNKLLYFYIKLNFIYLYRNCKYDEHANKRNSLRFTLILCLFLEHLDDPFVDRSARTVIYVVLTFG